MLDGEDQTDLTEELELEAEEADEVEDDEAEISEVEEETDPEDHDDDTGAEDEEAAALTVVIEGEEDEDEGSDGIRRLREAHKEQRRRIKELEEQVKAQTPAQELGPKPTLEGCDYDPAQFEAELTEWNERKREVDAKEAERAARAQEEHGRYMKRLEAYNASKAKLGAKDFDAAEEAVLEDFSVQQQSIIVAHSDRPELLVYALGKNAKARARLAATTDLISFAYELAKLEKGMTVTGVKKAQPEKRVSGGAGVPQTGARKLDQLKATAEKTGDYTAYFAAKRKAGQK